MKINKYPLLCPVADEVDPLLMPPCFKPFLTLSFCWTCCTCWSQAWSHSSFHRTGHSCLHFRSPWHILSRRSLLYVSCISIATTLHLFSEIWCMAKPIQYCKVKKKKKSQLLQPQPLLHFTAMDKGQTDTLQSAICAECLQYLTREVLLGVSTQMECSQEFNPGCLEALKQPIYFTNEDSKAQ